MHTVSGETATAARKRARLIWTAVTIAIASVFVSLFAGAPQPSTAASASGFDPSYIISDSLFYDSDAMSEAEIQAFLVGKGSVLGSFRASVASRSRLVSESTGDVRCEAFTGGTNLLASTIIFRAQSSCGISAKVLLVTLQKEQGLINRATSTQSALDRAMGYACPDTAPCAVDSLGFGNQVYKGALQLMTYKASRFARQPGPQAVGFHPNTSCGSTVVDVRNYATAALYSYTPYQPNTAALSNLYGVGDSCSSYGNRNFYVFYTDWFGSTLGQINPVGHIERVAGAPGNVEVSGWAFDRDTTGPISVHIYVNGVGTAIAADRSRPDVDAAYGGVGELHGFSAKLPVTSGGPQEVCVYGINSGPGANVLFGCQTVTVPSGSPAGEVKATSTSPGKVDVSGWAIDPDSVSPISVHIYVGGMSMATLADKEISTIPASYSAYGKTHGFAETLDAPTGSNQVCAYAINTGNGSNTLLGCRQVTVPSVPGEIPELGRAPFGALEGISTTPGNVTVSGWAIDPDTARPVSVHVYVGSKGVAVAADLARNDIGAVYPAYGPNHAYSVTIPATAGVYNVCAYAINSGPGPNTSLGCRSVSVN